MKQTSNSNVSKDKLVLILSISVFAYFLLFILSYRLKFDSITIVGVAREILDIPAFILLAGLFILAGISFVKERFKVYSLPFYSIIFLLVISIAMIVLL